ncbi:hypothetical protein N9335_01580 [Crocinitomicaceae bacterium]|nr:hypothetical protein [Crocinitomicaceae bacterium]
MKNCLLISILLLTSLSINAQTIKITVSEAQVFARFGTHTNEEVLKAPDVDEGIKQIDCDYTFDLQEKTSTFFSRSLGGEGNTLPIHNVIKNGNLYILEIADHGRHDASLSYPVKIYVDIENETMLYTWYDPYLERSFVSACWKLKMTLEGMQ